LFGHFQNYIGCKTTAIVCYNILIYKAEKCQVPLRLHLGLARSARPVSSLLLILLIKSPSLHSGQGPWHVMLFHAMNFHPNLRVVEKFFHGGLSTM